MNGCLGDGLSALVDGELASAEEAAARAHLATCGVCRHDLVAFERVRSLVRSLPALDLPPVVVERVRWLEHRRPSRVAVAAAAVAAAASLLFVAAAPTDPVTPPVDRLLEVHATSGVNGDPLTQFIPVAVPVSFGE